MSDIVEGYTRVSEVLSYFIEPALLDWTVKKGSNANRIKRQAMKIGSEVDEAIKMFVVTGKYGKVKSEEGKSCLEGFKRWFEAYNPVLKVGERLYSEEYKITGEPDLYWHNRIIDIKCASKIRHKYHVQNGAYCLLANLNISGILRLHKHLQDYEYVERSWKEVEKDVECFKAMLTVYNEAQRFLMGTERENSDVDNLAYKTI